MSYRNNHPTSTSEQDLTTGDYALLGLLLICFLRFCYTVFSYIAL